MASNTEFVTDVENHFDKKLRVHAQESATDLMLYIDVCLIHLTP